MSFLSDSTKVVQRRDWNFLLPAPASAVNFVVLGDGSASAADNARSVDSGASWIANAQILLSDILQHGPAQQVVAASSATARNWLSTDGGVSWVQGAAYAPPAFNWGASAYGNATYCFASIAGDIITSPDGLNWTVRAAAIADIATVCWTGTKFLAGGSTGNLLQSSPTGAVWTGAALFPFPDPSDVSTCLVKHNASIFSAGTRTDGSGTVIFESVDDGATWVPVFSHIFLTSPTKGASNGVACIITCALANFVYRFFGGAWSFVIMPVGGFTISVAYHNGAFIVLTNSGRVIKSIDNGATWAATDLSATISNGLSIA